MLLLPCLFAHVENTQECPICPLRGRRAAIFSRLPYLALEMVLNRQVVVAMVTPLHQQLNLGRATRDRKKAWYWGFGNVNDIIKQVFVLFGWIQVFQSTHCLSGGLYYLMPGTGPSRITLKLNLGNCDSFLLNKGVWLVKAQIYLEAWIFGLAHWIFRAIPTRTLNPRHKACRSSANTVLLYVR